MQSRTSSQATGRSSQSSAVSSSNPLSSYYYNPLAQGLVSGTWGSAYITVEPEGFLLREVAPGVEVERVRDRKSTRLNSSHTEQSRMPSSA